MKCATTSAFLLAALASRVAAQATPTAEPTAAPTPSPTALPTATAAPTMGTLVVWAFRVYNANTDERVGQYSTDHRNESRVERTVTLNLDWASYEGMGAEDINIECLAYESTDSMEFYIDDDFEKKETVVPFTLFGDNAATGDIKGNNGAFQSGETYKVTCQPFAENDEGEVVPLSDVSMYFEIIGGDPEDDEDDEESGDGVGYNADPECLVTPLEGGTFCAEEGVVVIEAEDFPTTGLDGWKKENHVAEATGGCYLTWDGKNQFARAGTSTAGVQFRVNNTDEYRFMFRSFIITDITLATEHNDAWVRILDDNMDPVVYLHANDNQIANQVHVEYEYIWPKGELEQEWYKNPEDNGTIPPLYVINHSNPFYRRPRGAPSPENAEGRPGWCKVYRHGPLGFWTHQSSVGDHQGYQMRMWLEENVTYTVEVSGRSKGHTMDRLILYTGKFGQSEAQDVDLPKSPLCP